MIETLMRKDLLDLTAYPTAERSLTHRLHANESPWDWLKEDQEAIAALVAGTAFNHYPDGGGQALREALGRLTGSSPEGIVLGSGSDELIKMTAELFLEPGDAVVIHTPTFSEYGVAARICGGRVVAVPSGPDFAVDVDAVIQAANRERAKLIFLCTPNNPTGVVLSRESVLRVVAETRSVVVCDEAYCEFSGVTVAREAQGEDRLIVLRTLSKAYGLAGLRLGYAVCTEAAAAYLNRVRMPYNISSLSQGLALLALQRQARVTALTDRLRRDRQALYEAAREIPGLEVFCGGANFLLYRTPQASAVAAVLAERGVMTRLFSQSQMHNCIRINIGTEEANRLVLAALREVDHAAG